MIELRNTVLMITGVLGLLCLFVVPYMALRRSDYERIIAFGGRMAWVLHWVSLECLAFLAIFIGAYSLLPAGTPKDIIVLLSPLWLIAGVITNSISDRIVQRG